NYGDAVGGTPIDSQLRVCGVTPADTESLGSDTDVSSWQTALLHMRSAGVTSVICLCEYGNGGLLLARYATAQGYYPEWLLSTNYLEDQDHWLKGFWPADQLADAFGLTFEPRQVPNAVDPAIAAVFS